MTWFQLLCVFDKTKVVLGPYTFNGDSFTWYVSVLQIIALRNFLLSIFQWNNKKSRMFLSSMSLALCGQYEFMPKLLPKSCSLNYFETLSTHYTGVINKPIVKRFCSSIWYSIQCHWSFLLRSFYWLVKLLLHCAFYLAAMASSFVPNTKCALGFYDHEARLGLTEYYKKQQAALYLKSSTIASGLIKNSHFGES